MVRAVGSSTIGVVWTELAEPDRQLLARTLDDWWAENDLRTAVRVTGREAKISAWAVVVLSFGPAIDFELTDERWVQVATCQWLFGPQYTWLGQGRRSGVRAAAAGRAHPGRR